jgi:hypothetical protein
MWFEKRGLVVKIGDGRCIILTRKGTYERIPVPAPGIRVGAEVSYPAISTLAKPMMLAASLLVLFVCGYLFSRLGLPAAAAYVSVDINPSLELSVDKSLDVIAVKYFNNDAVNLLKQENLKGKTLKDALSIVVGKAIAQNYLKPDQDNLIVSTVTPSGTGAVPVAQQSVQQFLEQPLNAVKLAGDVRVYSATADFRTVAESHGVSPGKYLIYEQLSNEGKQVSIGKISNTSIRELVDTYKISLLPDYTRIVAQSQQNGGEPQFMVDDNGRAVSMADFFMSHNQNAANGWAAQPQKAGAGSGKGAPVRRGIQGVLSPGKASNNTYGTALQSQQTAGKTKRIKKLKVIVPEGDIPVSPSKKRSSPGKRVCSGYPVSTWGYWGQGQ